MKGEVAADNAWDRLSMPMIKSIDPAGSRNDFQHCAISLGFQIRRSLSTRNRAPALLERTLKHPFAEFVIQKYPAPPIQPAFLNVLTPEGRGLIKIAATKNPLAFQSHLVQEIALWIGPELPTLQRRLSIVASFLKAPEWLGWELRPPDWSAAA
jgi:hypothetical protein